MFCLISDVYCATCLQLNFWPDNGGIGWYVDQTLGPGHDPEEFFLHDAPQAAYRHWVRTHASACCRWSLMSIETCGASQA